LILLQDLAVKYIVEQVEQFLVFDPAYRTHSGRVAKHRECRQRDVRYKLTNTSHGAFEK
jgi:hypothetical protein